jgi:hypothetical protein
MMLLFNTTHKPRVCQLDHTKVMMVKCLSSTMTLITAPSKNGEQLMLLKMAQLMELTSAWFGLTLKTTHHQAAVGTVTQIAPTATISTLSYPLSNLTARCQEFTQVNTSGSPPWEVLEHAQLLPLKLPYGMHITMIKLHSAISLRSGVGQNLT